MKYILTNPRLPSLQGSRGRHFFKNPLSLPLKKGENGLALQSVPPVHKERLGGVVNLQTINMTTSTMKHLLTPDELHRSAKIMSDEKFPDVHSRKISSWQLIGPDEFYAMYNLGNLSSHRLSISINTYEPGGGSATHVHPDWEQAFYIISGQAAITVGEEERVVGPGSVTLMPPGMPHSFRNAGDEPLTLLVISSFPENKPSGDRGNNR